jgi:hypothetical protein
MRKHSFVLAEVLISLIIFGLCAALFCPFFQELCHGYQRMQDGLRAEYLIEEVITDTYASYLIKPPTYDKVKEGFSTENQVQGFLIFCTAEKTVDDATDPPPQKIQSKQTFSVRRKRAPTLDETKETITLCFQKNNA